MLWVIFSFVFCDGIEECLIGASGNASCPSNEFQDIIATRRIFQWPSGKKKRWNQNGIHHNTG
jgi:hypothetical protein